VRSHVTSCLTGLLLEVSVLLATSGTPQNPDPAGGALHAPPYHDSPPADALPATLDPKQFAKTHSAFVAYSVARTSESVLYQVPCYCGCDKEQGHKSLFDCFTTSHGAMCHICQKEAMFCYLEKRRRKTPTDIRKSLADGKASTLDLTKYVERFYPKLRKANQ